MPSADSIQLCRNPFYDEQDGGPHAPDHIHQLAQIQLADGSHAEAFYDSRGKKIVFEYQDIYYECPRTLTLFDTLHSIININRNIQLSQESWTDKGQLDYDEALLTSWKTLRERHRTLQLVIDAV